MNRTGLASGWAALLATALCQAQPVDPKASPLEAATASKAEQPVTMSKAGQTTTSDADILRLVKVLTGSFASEARGETPALRYNAASVNIGGLDNAVFFEIARADNQPEPFRVGLVHAYRRKGDLRLRVFDLPAHPAGLKDAVVGLWAAPDAFPKLDASRLTPNVDMPLKVEGESGFSGDTAEPVPTTRDGAIEMTSTLRAGKDTLAFGDVGFDADGKQVWGTPGGERVLFRRVEPAFTRAPDSEGGLIMLTLVPPAKGAEKLAEGGQATVMYTGWLADGTHFDSTRSRQPVPMRIPGPAIQGWNDGLARIAKGERRRLVIPPALGYGERGRRPIPPNATLIFDVECLHVDNSQIVPPVPPPHPQPGSGPSNDAPKPATPSPQSDQPIGNPPTSGTPEKPR